MDDDKLWSAPYHPTPKTGQGFINLREWARKKAIEMAVKRYFDGMEGARKLRLYGEYPKKRISDQQYQAPRFRGLRFAGYAGQCVRLLQWAN